MDKPKEIQDIDLNTSDFYDKINDDIHSHLARMKKSIETVLNLRLAAAELQVETAALYHAELACDILDMGHSPGISADEDDVAEDTPFNEFV